MPGTLCHIQHDRRWRDRRLTRPGGFRDLDDAMRARGARVAGGVEHDVGRSGRRPVRAGPGAARRPHPDLRRADRTSARNTRRRSLRQVAVEDDRRSSRRCGGRRVLAGFGRPHHGDEGDEQPDRRHNRHRRRDGADAAGAPRARLRRRSGCRRWCRLGRRPAAEAARPALVAEAAPGILRLVRHPDRIGRVSVENVPRTRDSTNHSLAAEPPERTLRRAHSTAAQLLGES